MLASHAHRIQLLPLVAEAVRTLASCLHRFLDAIRRPRLCLPAFLLAFLLCLTPPVAVSATQPPAEALPTLTTIGAIHRMTSRQARRGYPVHVRAVVTYYDPFPDHPQHPTLVVTDRTGTIFISITGPIPRPIKPGTVLEITGITDPGEFAPVIVQPTLRIVKQGSLPRQAPHTTLYRLLKGSDDPAWVEIEGVVEGVQTTRDNVTLKLGLADGQMAATTVAEPGVQYASLVDALVTIRGVAGSLFNRQGQISGDQLFFSGKSAITVERAAPLDPFSQPIGEIGSLMRYAPGKVYNHRSHIQGVVTLLWPGRLLCLADASGSLCAITAQTTPLLPGQMVDVAGFAGIGQIAPILSDAVYRPLPTQHQHVLPIAIEGGQGWSGSEDARLVQIDGQLIEQDRALKDFTILVSAGKFTFPVSLPRSPESSSLLNIEEGSLVRVTGICAVQTDPTVLFHNDGHPKIKFFQIFLRSPADIVVLRKPSWWTAAHTIRVLACAFAVTLCILAWSLYLRRRLRLQTELLHFQATHDGLTGIWNRKAICDLLQRESELASRVHQQVGIIMLDADGFKQINDTLGHPAGDAVLTELAQRIQLAVRSYDITGRYGGEEFLIVLPSCTVEEVEACAERVRAKVAEHPFDACGAQLAVTVSLGATVLNPRLDTQQNAMAAADRALYQAKLSGRNRVVSATADLRSTAQPYPQHPKSTAEF